MYFVALVFKIYRFLGITDVMGIVREK